MLKKCCNCKKSVCYLLGPKHPAFNIVNPKIIFQPFVSRILYSLKMLAAWNFYLRLFSLSYEKVIIQLAACPAYLIYLDRRPRRVHGRGGVVRVREQHGGVHVLHGGAVVLGQVEDGARDALVEAAIADTVHLVFGN